MRRHDSLWGTEKNRSKMKWGILSEKYKGQLDWDWDTESTTFWPEDSSMDRISIAAKPGFFWEPFYDMVHPTLRCPWPAAKDSHQQLSVEATKSIPRLLHCDPFACPLQDGWLPMANGRRSTKSSCLASRQDSLEGWFCSISCCSLKSLLCPCHFLLHLNPCFTPLQVVLERRPKNQTKTNL